MYLPDSEHLLLRHLFISASIGHISKMLQLIENRWHCNQHSTVQGYSSPSNKGPSGTGKGKLTERVVGKDTIFFLTLTRKSPPKLRLLVDLIVEEAF